MAGGWGNELMRRENEFLLLDGMYVNLPSLIAGANRLVAG